MIGEQKLNLIDILNKSTIRVLCYSFSLQPGTPRFFTMNNIDDLVKCSCIISKEILCRITFIKKNKPIFNINLNVTSNITTNINIHDKSKK